MEFSGLFHIALPPFSDFLHIGPKAHSTGVVEVPDRDPEVYPVLVYLAPVDSVDRERDLV